MTDQEDFDEDLDREGFRVTGFFEGFTERSFFNAWSKVKGLNDKGFSFAIPGIVLNPLTIDKSELSLRYCWLATSSHIPGGGGCTLPVSLALYEEWNARKLGSSYRAALISRPCTPHFPFPHVITPFHCLRGWIRFASINESTSRLTMSRDEALKQGRRPHALSNCYNFVSFSSLNSYRFNQSANLGMQPVSIPAKLVAWVSSLLQLLAKRSRANTIVIFKQTRHDRFRKWQIRKLLIPMSATLQEASLPTRRTVRMRLPGPFTELARNPLQLAFLALKSLLEAMNRFLKRKHFLVHVCLLSADRMFITRLNELNNCFFAVCAVEKESLWYAPNHEKSTS